MPENNASNIKTVIIINGNGGAGKDTLCGFAAQHYKTRNVSSITPIKEIAEVYGGWNGAKDAKSRKFLADLKQLFVDYNDLPFRYLCGQYEEFLRSDEELMFVHIREADEIQKFNAHVKTSCLTLLVTREQNTAINWGNASDDNVHTYDYDYTYANNKSLEEAELDFCSFLSSIVSRNAPCR